MPEGAAGGSVEVRNEGDRDNFIEDNGMREKFKKLIFIVVEFILAIRKNICQQKLFVFPFFRERWKGSGIRKKRRQRVDGVLRNAAADD